jgi:hypothetical protein
MVETMGCEPINTWFSMGHGGGLGPSGWVLARSAYAWLVRAEHSCSIVRN